MSIVQEIMDALDKIPIWKRIQQMPPEMDALKVRMDALEAKFSGKYPPDVCKFCGERAARMTASFGPNAKGMTQSDWTCSVCQQVETRVP